jgi:amino acid transporter
VGLTLTPTRLTSMATHTNLYADNNQALFGGPWIVMVIAFLGVMTLVNFWGIRQSMWTNIACAAVEIGGLVFIIAVGARFWGSVDYLETPRATFDAQGRIVDHGLGVSMLLAGSVLTFYSFIGFEDMLNVAEEVKEPRRTMPWGIILALSIATLLYIGVAVTAISVVPHRELAEAAAPLSAIAARAAPWLPPLTFDFITLFAVTNTMLINYIMGSRLLYGMARQGLLPAALGRVHSKRRTPHVAILTLLVVVLVLALSGGDDAIRALASATSLLLLFSFIVVNGALVALKSRPGEPVGAFEVPVVIPLLGILVNGALIVTRLVEPGQGWRAPMIAGVIALAATILYFVLRPTNVTEEALASVEAEA